jgi:hypothetical protein
MMMPGRPLLRLLAIVSVLVVMLAAGRVRGQLPAYFPDDPIARDPETQDASKVVEWAISDPYDFIENTFFKPGDRSPRRAMNVNTIDEVPDSSWFTNRAGARPLTVEEVRRGDETSAGPAPGKWTIVSGKSDGVTPGFTIRDAAGITWFIKFDPPSNPEMSTGAEMISTTLFWTLGYHVPDNHLAVMARNNLERDPKATIRDLRGRHRALTEDDVDGLLMQAARNEDGTYRVIASRALPGQPVGPFRYFATRPDDPNDIYPHEHRRELRGLRVFAAWLNHDDSRSINSLDTIVERDGRRLVWHHLIDFGSTLGSGSIYAQKPRAGNEYLWEARPTIITALTLGLWVRPWIRVEYPDFKSVGNFEASFFQPEAWKPEYPNAAFDQVQPDDLFWAARRVMAIPDEWIGAAVDAARYSDERAREYVQSVLIARRDKVGLAWLTHVNPLVDFALSNDGTLTFRNAAVDARGAAPADAYSLQWARFDNNTGEAAPVGTVQRTTTLSATAPAAMLTAPFVEVRVAAHSTVYPSWAEPVIVRFRKQGPGGWSLVGLRRGPEPAAAERAK